MALIKCNECGHKVSDRAKTCPNCGVEIEAKPVKKNRSKLLMVLIGVMVIIGFTQFMESRMPPEVRLANEQAREQRRRENAQQEARRAQEEDEKRCTSGSTAYVMSQQYVRQRLKSPTTATFPGGSRDYQTQYMGDCIHRVVAYVDSQNSFGAMIRTPYYAEMQYIRNSRNKWRLLDLKIQ